MFEGMDFSKLSGMLGDIQEKAKAMQEENKNKTFNVKAGGGMVSIDANGAGEIIDLQIDDSLMEDKESLQILLIAAMSDIVKMIDNQKKSSIMDMAKDFKL